MNNTQDVNEFMDKLDHPFKAEVQAIREIILNVDENITERIKWKAPSFSYKGYMATFNLWARQHVHLIFHNGAILSHAGGVLEGDYPDRRMVYFSDMQDVISKKDALEKLIREWIKLMDKQGNMTPSELITKQIAGLPDWRGKLFARLRQLILAADPAITEEWKWDTAVWTQNGLVCSAGAFKDHMKLNFFKGASLQDPNHLFNAGLEAKATRAIDFSEADVIDESTLKELIRAAVAYNTSGSKQK